MKAVISAVSLSVVVLICFYPCRSATAQSSSSPSIGSHTALNVEEVVNRLIQGNIERAQALTAYRGTRVYRLEYHGFAGSRTAEMVVNVSYRSPQTKEFSIQSESGSRLLIERVFHKLLQTEKEALNLDNQANVALNRDNYRFALLGNTSTPTGPCYILSVEPLPRTSFSTAEEFGSMQKTLLWCALRRRLQKILPSGRKRAESNRLMPRWEIFGFPS